MGRKIIILSFLILSISGILFIANSALAVCPQQFAFVDKRASTFPSCLKIDEYMACGGDLEIQNNCSNPLVIGGRIIPAGETEYGFKEVDWQHESPDQAVQKWELHGDMNGEIVLVKGRTENWSNLSSFESFINTISPFELRGLLLLLPLQYKVTGVIVITGLIVYMIIRTLIHVIIKTLKRNN